MRLEISYSGSALTASLRELRKPPATYGDAVTVIVGYTQGTWEASAASPGVAHLNGCSTGPAFAPQ